MKWQEIMQGSHDEPQQGANGMSAKFIISRGCPIRHLARMEAKNKALIEQVIEHDPPIKDESKNVFATKLDQFQLIFTFMSSHTVDQLKEVSAFVSIILYIVHNPLYYLYVFHVFSTPFACRFYCQLRRKGSYFSQSVNGFV